MPNLSHLGASTSEESEGGGVDVMRDLRDMSSPEGRKIWRQVAQAGDSLPEWIQEHIRKAARESVRGA